MQEPGIVDAASHVELEAVAPGINLVRPAEVSAPAPVSQLPDPEVFARKYLEESGLARLRPPLTPAASGDAFISVIPYQVGSLSNQSLRNAVSYKATRSEDWCLLAASTKMDLTGNWIIRPNFAVWQFGIWVYLHNPVV